MGTESDQTRIALPLFHKTVESCETKYFLISSFTPSLKSKVAVASSLPTVGLTRHNLIGKTNSESSFLCTGFDFDNSSQPLSGLDLTETLHTQSYFLKNLPHVSQQKISLSPIGLEAVQARPQCQPLLPVKYGPPNRSWQSSPNLGSSN